MNRIKQITLEVIYITHHLYEYVHDVPALQQKLQGLLNEAWECVDRGEGTENEAVYIKSLVQLIEQIIDLEERQV